MNTGKFAKGFFSKELKREISSEPCGYCHFSRVVELIVYQKYVVNFSIPFYPTGKRVISICNYCKKLLEYNEMPVYTKIQAKTLKSSTNTPLWTYMGLVVVFIIMICLYLIDKSRKDKDTQYFKTPQIGDVYEYETVSQKYSIMKIVSMKYDTIYLLDAKNEVDKVKDLHVLDYNSDSAYYIEDTIYYLKNELIDMYNKEKIIGVKRN